MARRLHLDLITEILSRLPVKTLLRFRSVSKPWCSLIDSPRFITLHLNTNSDLSLIIHSYNNPLSSLDFDPYQNLTSIPHPFLPGHADALSSCNGLLLLRGPHETLSLFNPSTRKHFNIPFPVFHRPDPDPFPDSHLDAHFSFGLGFDPVADDYKVILLIRFYDDEWEWIGSESSFYTLKSNSWKKNKEFPYELPSGRQWGVPLQGGFHIIVKECCYYDWPKLLVSIDIATEDYKTLPLPEIPHGKMEELSLDRLGKCLCLSVLHKTFNLEFWVMKVYGVGESWTKLLYTAPLGVDRPNFRLDILAYSKCGSKILFTRSNREFIWCDLKNRATVNIPFEGLPPIFHAHLCFNSLVRPDAYGKIANNEESEKTKNEGKED